METIVVDANIVVALFDTQDATHEQAVALVNGLRARRSLLVMVNLVIYEILTVLRMKDCLKEARGFYDLAHTDPRMQVVYVTAELEASAYRHFREAGSKNMSFADASLIAVAEAAGADAIASFDGHIKRYSKSVPVIASDR